jgi:hypothetical protein
VTAVTASHLARAAQRDLSSGRCLLLAISPGMLPALEGAVANASIDACNVAVGAGPAPIGGPKGA